MNRFNSLINTHFKSCQLIHTEQDENRNRLMNFFVIQDHKDLVGISDGVDSWIAPLTEKIRKKIVKAESVPRRRVVFSEDAVIKRRPTRRY